MKPNFIIVGAQKGGTSSAKYHFNGHPEIFMPKQEVHFFDTGYNKGTEWYESLFEDNKAIGEKTPSYMYLEKAIDRIYDYDKNIKLVCFLRDPVKRAISHWNHYKQEGATTLNFEEFIEKTSCLRRGYYIDQINYILKKFKRENLYIAISEHVHEDPKTEYNKIFRFLGVKEMEISFNENIHKREYKEKPDEKTVERLKEIYKPFNEKLFDFLGYQIKQWL